MRARIALPLAAALLAAAFAQPAAAVKRRVPVPFFHCYVYVETHDAYVEVSNRGLRLERWGSSTVSTDC